MWQVDGDGEVLGMDAESGGPIRVTTIVCTVAAAMGHAVLWVSYALKWGEYIPWQPVAAISLSIVAVAGFGGFYLASRRARIAIASSFLLTFLVALTYMLTIDELGELSTNAQALFDDFRNVVLLIVGFYFGTDAAVGVAKVLRTAPESGNVQAADRDLVSPAPRAASLPR